MEKTILYDVIHLITDYSLCSLIIYLSKRHQALDAGEFQYIYKWGRVLILSKLVFGMSTTLLPKKRQSSHSIPLSAMKSYASLFGFRRYSREFAYISSVFVLILFSVEASNINGNFDISWGTVKLLNNGQTAQLTMDQISGKVFHFYGHPRFNIV